MLFNAYIGFDLRMPDAYMVAARSMLNRCSVPLVVKPLLLPHLRSIWAYSRKSENRDGVQWDVISDAPMSTQFAISRFLIPALQDFKGVSIFCDSDFLFRADVEELVASCNPRHAVSCVKHQYAPREHHKMDGQLQTLYDRKNWSSMMVFNNAHPSNRWLTKENVNRVPGRDLHQFCWLKDDEIGALDPAWNWLEGHSSMDINPKAVHYTRGTPDMQGYEDAPYSDEWRGVLGQI